MRSHGCRSRTQGCHGTTCNCIQDQPIHDGVRAFEHRAVRCQQGDKDAGDEYIGNRNNDVRGALEVDFRDGLKYRCEMVDCRKVCYDDNELGDDECTKQTRDELVLVAYFQDYILVSGQRCG